MNHVSIDNSITSTPATTVDAEDNGQPCTEVTTSEQNPQSTIKPAKPAKAKTMAKAKAKTIKVTGTEAGGQEVALSDTTALTAEESEQLAVLESAIKEANGELADLDAKIQTNQAAKAEKFHTMALALNEIQVKRLYRQDGSLETYSKLKFGIERAQANRIIGAGKIIARLSPMGDNATIIKMFTSERHFRPLVGLKDDEQNAVIQMLVQWVKWAGTSTISTKMVRAAVSVSAAPTKQGESKVKSTPGEKFEAAALALKAELPENTPVEAHQVFEKISLLVAETFPQARRTGIAWTEMTWNPLQGCSRVGDDCDHCYALGLICGRMRNVYPGLITEKTGKDGKMTHAFNGTIKVLPEELGEPLQIKTPTRIFVNSMSDLFHKNVPEGFIEAVFDVMEKAWWHTFQVLTKRPERMAKFTTKRYAVKAPPGNIWLGTSVGYQKAWDDRYPHLLKVKAAVRWLSVEPLIGKIDMESLDDIDWVVVGGESGRAARKMEKAWVTAIRDACLTANVPLFLKQWGVYGEDGNKLPKLKKAGKKPMPTLDGVVHEAYPVDSAKAEVPVDDPQDQVAETSTKEEAAA